jgi:hypothetical protein
MRLTYTISQFFGFHPITTRFQTPRKVVWHRQGNPGAEGESGIAWGARTGAFTIHHYIDDGICLSAVPENRHAYHVKEHRWAPNFGLVTNGVHGIRGDYDTIGVELEDESPTSTPLAPGQAYGLSQETRITAVLLGADILRRWPLLTTADFIEHADLDPITRAEDVGDALYLPDFRKDVDDVLAGRTPWRTVGKFATGTQTTETGPVFTQADLDAAEARGFERGKRAGRVEMWEAWKRETVNHLNWVAGLENPWNIRL